MKYRRVQWIFLAAMILCVPLLEVAVAAPPHALEQPMWGPGGYLYAHMGVTKNGPYYPTWHEGDGDYRYYIYEPADPRPEFAPVVLFLHGYQALDPQGYEKWINHIVRKGYVVVWVQYDRGNAMPWGYLGHAMVTWRHALRRLDTFWWEDHVLPEKDENWEIKTAVVGHSAGGFLAANVAVRATDPAEEIPLPRAVVSIEPGGLRMIPKEDFSRIDPGTKLVVMVADEDEVVCKGTARTLWAETSQIADEDRDFLLSLSDSYGYPEQLANHFFPNTSGWGDTTWGFGGVDARDYSITYKLSVGLLNCTFRGIQCPYALGHGSPEQVDMGTWSDGVPIRPLVWVEDPGALETTCEDSPLDDPPEVWGADEAQAAVLYGETATSAAVPWNWLFSGLSVGLFCLLRRASASDHSRLKAKEATPSTPIKPKKKKAVVRS